MTIDEADAVISTFRGVVARGEASWKNAPDFIRRIIREEMWQHRYVADLGKDVDFDRFEDFVTALVPEGLETSIDMLLRLCRDDKDALDLIDRAIQNPAGPHIVQGESRAPTGNSEQTALRRLRKDRPDLHRRVLAGELSAHAAMVEAGFRRRTLNIPDEPRAAAAALRRHFQGDRLAELATCLARPVMPFFLRRSV
jgi:hypothetical protein